MVLVVCRTYVLLELPLEFEAREPSWRAFRLGDWLVEPLLNRLSKSGSAIQLELKVMDVLVCLADRAGEVVSRREITDTVWSTGFISDNTVTHAITEIRNALGDDARNPAFIETIHRRGYRLIAPVEPAGPEDLGGLPVAGALMGEGGDSRDLRCITYSRLAAFLEEDPEILVGGQTMVVEMWRKLTGRHLLVVIEPLPGWRAPLEWQPCAADRNVEP
jgi:DNA-binding winged helix-turn-helix (wHTH) protein